MIPTILQIGDKVLRRKTEKIRKDNITSDEVRRIIQKMSETLRKEPIGIGLAAPQIGISKAIFIVSEYVLRPDALEETSDRISQSEEVKKKKTEEKYLVFINPDIIKFSKKKAILTEGCLSVAGKFGKVKRSTNVTIEAHDENGIKFKRGAGGLLAHVIQHEVDHLNGILFVDKAKNVEKT